MIQRTFRGMMVNPLRLQTADININIIAHALANQCRHAGHTESFYSVAQHSVYVKRLMKLYWSGLASCGSLPLMERLALIHDGAETWWQDIVHPLKYQWWMLPYRLAEKRAQRAVYARFGSIVNSQQHQLIKHVEAELFKIEDYFNFNAEWPDNGNEINKTIGFFEFWPPETAEKIFLDEWRLVDGD